MNTSLHMIGDHVRYCGKNTFVDDKGEPLNINGKVGEVISRVQNTCGLVVEFGSYTFIVHPDNLSRHDHREQTDNRQMDRLMRKWATT